MNNHLGNVLTTVTDRKIPKDDNSDGTIDYFTADISSTADYYAFGMLMPGRNFSSDKYRFGFNGKEKLDELHGNTGDAYDFGARLLDVRSGRWLAVDPFSGKYPNWSPFAFSVNNPISSYDPDGKRVFFVGGAGNDQIGWNYIDKFDKIFTDKGIKGFTPLKVSHDDPAKLKAGGTPIGDIVFTAAFRSSRYDKIPSYGNPGLSLTFKKTDEQIKNAVNDILSDLTKNPLAKGEQLNLTGYSYGSVLLAHAALELADKGKKIDNLVLIGSSISTNSDLYKELEKYQKAGKIGRIIRYDIKNETDPALGNDKLSNPPNAIGFIQGGIQNRDPQNIGTGPHFDLASPDNPATKDIDEGKKTEDNIGKLADNLKEKGVK